MTTLDPVLAAPEEFSWSDALVDLGWSGGEDPDLGWTMVGRHVAAGRGGETAVHWVGADGTERRVTFAELDNESARVANVLRGRGIGLGDRVATVLPRVPLTVAIMIGVLRAGAILVPIFSGFGIDAVSYRLSHSGAKVAIAAGRYRDVIVANGVDVLTLREAGHEWREGDGDLADLMDAAPDVAPGERRARDAPAFIVYTSGSTGQPKGCVIAANFLSAMWPYARFALGLRRDDVFWPTGDPSWGYGLCCYLPSLALGIGVISVERNASAQLTLDLIHRLGVTNLATTPTVLRSLMAEQPPGPGTGLRAISSCGEPLNRPIVEFFRDGWGVVPMDHFGATEMGLPICNHNAFDRPVRPGSMGIPTPGQEVAVVDESGTPMPIGKVGLLGHRPHDGSRYFLRYWENPEATEGLQRDGWTCPGDLVRRDADGYFWFEGRSDDIIKSAGYRIGPFEVESAILKHPDVVEVAVVGVPDPVRGQIIKAFVVLAPQSVRRAELCDEIVAITREHCGRHVYPRAIGFLDALPKTDTGKIQRFRLRSLDASKGERA